MAEKGHVRSIAAGHSRQRAAAPAGAASGRKCERSPKDCTKRQRRPIHHAKTFLHDGAKAMVSGEVLPRRRSCVETLRAPSLPLVAPPLGFPRYGSLEAWKFSFYEEALPHILYIPYFKARNGGRRSQPQSDRWSPKRFAPPLRLCGPNFPRTLLLHTRIKQTAADGRPSTAVWWPLPYLEARYSLMALAARRPSPIARMTVAAPRTMSPPA